MNHAHHFLSIPLIAVLVFLAGRFVVRTITRSEDPTRMVVKWLITLPLLVLLFVAAPAIGLVGPFLIVACAVVFSLVWTPHIGAWMAKPLTSMFDDGDRQIEAKPFYSAALAHRKRGRYPEAIAGVRKELAKFPNDFDGQMLLAEILAEHMNDMPGAELTIQRLIAQPGHAPRSLAYALNSLADWHLKYDQDRQAAGRDLEKIIELLPNSEMSAAASQRRAHLAATEQLLSPHDRRKIVVTPGVEDIGLLSGALQPKAPEIDPGKQATDYVRHLQAHPLDTEAREKLAVIYADHFQRLDLATEQLEQLIAAPNQPARHVAHWLNLLADLQLKHGAKYETLHATLQRVMDLFPDTAAASLAASRIAHLRLDLKGKEKSQAVKLGSYEEDVGLKRGSPHQL